MEVSARILPDGRWQGFVRDISEREAAGGSSCASRRNVFRLALRGAWTLRLWDWNVALGDMVFNQRWAEMRWLSRPDDLNGHVDSLISAICTPKTARGLSLEDYFQGWSAIRVEHHAESLNGWSPRPRGLCSKRAWSRSMLRWRTSQPASVWRSAPPFRGEIHGDPVHFLRRDHLHR